MGLWPNCTPCKHVNITSSHWPHSIWNQEKYFALKKQIDKRQKINLFEEMLSTTTFSTNLIALIICITLTFSSLTIFVLLSIALYYCHKRHRQAKGLINQYYTNWQTVFIIYFKISSYSNLENGLKLVLLIFKRQFLNLHLS